MEKDAREQKDASSGFPYIFNLAYTNVKTTLNYFSLGEKVVVGSK